MLLLFGTKVPCGVEERDRMEGQCDQWGKHFSGEWESRFLPLLLPLPSSDLR